MPRITRLLPLALALSLLACATPQEQCIYEATRELHTVESLLAEVEANIARGYAWEEYQQTTPQWVQCMVPVPPPPGVVPPPPPQMMSSLCLRDVTETLRRQVPIDPAAEARKRDGLRAKRAELNRAATTRIAQCRALYPE